MVAHLGSPFPFNGLTDHIPILLWSYQAPKQVTAPSLSSPLTLPHTEVPPSPALPPALPHVPRYQFRSRGCTKEMGITSSCPGLSQKTPASPCTGETGSCCVSSLCWGALPSKLCLPAFLCYKPLGKLPQAKRRKAKRANLYNIKK